MKKWPIFVNDTNFAYYFELEYSRERNSSRSLNRPRTSRGHFWKSVVFIEDSKFAYTKRFLLGNLVKSEIRKGFLKKLEGGCEE